MYRVYTITIYDIRKYTIRVYTTTALIINIFINFCFTVLYSNSNYLVTVLDICVSIYYNNLY